MSTLGQFYGRVTLLSGLAAMSIVAGWSYFYFRGFDFSTAPFISYLLTSLLFQYVTPVLCVSAFFFGFSSRCRFTAKIGMALAFMALVSYAAYILVVYRLIRE